MPDAPTRPRELGQQWDWGGYGFMPGKVNTLVLPPPLRTPPFHQAGLGAHPLCPTPRTLSCPQNGAVTLDRRADRCVCPEMTYVQKGSWLGCHFSTITRKGRGPFKPLMIL